MAKSKFKVPKEDGAIKEKVLPKEGFKIVVEPSVTEQVVFGTAHAEKLQTSGWQLIDCHLTRTGEKEYKFRKVN